MTAHVDNVPCICGKVDCTTAYGLCHCGCGKTTSISPKTDCKLFKFKGKPMRFIEGHQGRIRPQLEEAAPFKIDGVYCRLIPLTQGFHAIVWESDYLWLMQWKWCAYFHPKTRCFYAVRNGLTINGKKTPIPMHRFILGLEPGNPQEADHIETGHTLDNRRSNLRVANLSQQRCNTRKSKRNTSGYKGVSLRKHTGKWKAQISINGKVTNLGQRDTAEEAWRELYVPAALKHYGEFARIA